MAVLKDLYLGKTLEDLQVHYNLPDLSKHGFKKLVNTAQRLYENAEENRLKGDEELAYVSYMKYFNLLSCIHKKSEYAGNKQLVKTQLGDNDTNRRIMDKLETITNSLSQRYNDLKKCTSTTSTLPKAITLLSNGADGDAGSLHCKNREMTNGIMKSETDTRSIFEQLGLISCRELFEKTQQKSVLIMDCRSSKDYQISHLTYPWAFNVPEELIVAGMSAGKLQDRLDSSSKAKWAARSIKDHVVLMDWKTKDAEPAQGSPIAILLDILKNWDPDVNYRSPIQILDGGYSYFIMMYPTLCTNPSVQAPHQNNNEMEIIDDIEYPSINDITMKDEVSASKTNDKNGILQPHNKSTTRTRPSVDRATKRAALLMYEEKTKPISDLVNEQAEFLQKAQVNDKMLEETAKKLESVVSSDLNSETNNSVQQELRYKLMQLESKAEDYKIENERLREELNRFKEEQQQEQNAKISAKDLEVTKEIENKIKEREKLDEQHKREREERAYLLATARKTKPYYKPSSNTATTPQPYDSPFNKMKKSSVQPGPDMPLINDENIQNDNYYEDNDLENHVDERGSDPYFDKENYSPRDLKPQFDRAMKPKNFVKTNNYNNLEDNTELIISKKRDFSPVRSTKVGRGLTGLKNLGNTCYMNSILQCLSNTPQLTEYCISDKYKNYISRSNKTKGHIVEEVAALIKVLWNGNYKCVASRDLRYVVGQYQHIFGGFEQQDSHEFLTILMDWLHSDLQTLCVPRTYETISASEKAWLDFTKSKESLILHLFYGQIKSTVKCVTCHKESATYECFSNLSLELPANSSVCRLSECMDMYFNGERIYGWICPNCKQKREAIKKLDISKLPPVLVIHLKRFYADTDSPGNSYKKKQNYLRFPLENLDMTPYIAKAESRSDNPKTYQLYGVSNHYGSMESGHYTAFCKSANYGRWYKFDDQVVSSLDASNVVSSAAYILFYTWLPPIEISECN